MGALVLHPLLQPGHVHVEYVVFQGIGVALLILPAKNSRDISVLSSMTAQPPRRGATLLHLQTHAVQAPH